MIREKVHMLRRKTGFEERDETLASRKFLQ